jgi:hypothetical protein
MTPDRKSALSHFGFFALLLAASLPLLLRTLLNDGCLFCHDEQPYQLIASRWFGGERDFRGTPGVSPLPNLVFFSIFQWTWLFGDAYFSAAKILNVALLATMAVTVHAVARRFVAARLALLIAILSAWSPLSLYASTYLPEAAFQAFIWLALYAFVRSFEWRRTAGWVLPGALCGVAFLAKPNATALLAAMCATVLIVEFLGRDGEHSGSWLRIVSSILALVTGFLATVMIVRFALTGRFDTDVMGAYYTASLAANIETVDLMKHFARSSVLHAVALLILWAAPFAVLAANLATGAWRKLGRQALALLVITVLGLGTLVTGAIVSSIRFEAVQQLFGDAGIPVVLRYYHVLFPLLMIAFAAFLPASKDAVRSIRPSMMLFGISALFAGWVAVAKLRPGPFEAPDLFWVLLVHPQGLALLAASSAVACFACAASPRIGLRSLFALLTATTLASWVVLTFWQANVAEEGSNERLAGAAMTVTGLVPVASGQPGLVVAREFGSAQAFLFGLGRDADWLLLVAPERLPSYEFALNKAPNPPRWLKLEHGAALPAAAIPEGTPWIVLLDDVRLDSEAGACIGLHAATFCRLSGAIPVVRERLWAGEALLMRFSSGASDRPVLRGFYPPEAWGAWSQSARAAIVLPVRVQGRVRVVVEAQAYGGNIDRPLTISIGVASAPGVSFGRSVTRKTVCLDVADRADELLVSGLDARTIEGAPDPRTLGIGMHALIVEGVAASERCVSNGMP